MSDMRDFRDAKAMAQTLRQSLISKSVSISHSESLELVSKMLGAADWNTLSALIQSGGRRPLEPMLHVLDKAARYPAIPMRDLVPFPGATYPIFIGRAKTIKALEQAFQRQREVVLAIQRGSGVDEPGYEDVYEIGVLAALLELEQLPDGTIKVLAQVYRRVAIGDFVSDDTGYVAEARDLSEGPIPAGLS
jgi:ATP-dependent Lon protease